MPSSGLPENAPSAIAFDAILYGSPNLTLATGHKDIMGFQKRFYGDIDMFLMPQMQKMMRDIGDPYMELIRSRFAQTHGRTGETAGSVHQEFESFTEPGVAGAFRYRVVVGGNVGFVVTPLLSHIIPASRFSPLYNAQDGPFEGRTKNFYLPFGPVVEDILWYQGGPESYSPDTSWYTDEEENLGGWAFEQFRHLAARVTMFWGAGADYLVPMTMPSMNQIFYH